mgnify:CR=1 FL=1|tara:strand:+ start:234 stop:1319 length:1086 start_codon:yes stop_codon:yes gene_type:complete
MKYFIISGEASGDLYSSLLVSEIKKNDPNAVFKYLGGDKTKNILGLKPIIHINDLAIMGFVEVISKLRKVLKNLSLCKKEILLFNPDIVILIDYPGFNLRIAKFLNKHKLKSLYYVSPQIWAWHKSRIFKIKKYINNMCVILPFEKKFYNSYDFNVSFVGHPLLDILDSKKNSISVSKNISFMPGSRKQEIKKILPIMLSIIKYYPDYKFYILGIHSLGEYFYKKIVKNHNIEVVFENKNNILNKSSVALVASGTATLETAIFKIPQIVCYKTNIITYYLAKFLIKVPFISLVNLVLRKEAVKELIQFDFNTLNLKKELDSILEKSNRDKIILDYDNLIKLLGSGGATKKTASVISDILKR